MTPSEVLKRLKEYSYDETVYRKLFDLKDDVQKAKAYLNSIDWSDEKNAYLIRPEEIWAFGQPHLDDEYFRWTTHENINLQKHSRYTPPYEHDHSFFELIYVVSGTCENNIFGGTDILKKGDLCMMSPSVKHSIWTEEGLVINILIRLSTIQRYFGSFIREKGLISEFFTNSLYLRDFATCLVFHTGDDKQLKDEVLQMYGEQLDSDIYSESIISSMLIIFFNHLLRKYSDTAQYPSTVKKQNETVSKILELIVNNYSSVTLPQIAGELGYSADYCSKYIKNVTGYNFSELLKNARLRQAKDWLKSTSMSVAHISEQLGYENPENFMRAFKREFDISPSEYREKMRR